MQNELLRQTGNLRDAVDKFIQENLIPAAGAISSGPPANVYETGSTIEVTMALPGVNTESLEVSASGENIRIRGSYHNDAPLDVKVLKQELPRGKFEKSIALPVAVETDTASAQYQDWMLTLSLPKATKSLERPIAVQVRDKSGDKVLAAPGSAITKPAENKRAATRQPQASPLIDMDADEVDIAADSSFPASDPPPTSPGSV